MHSGGINGHAGKSTGTVRCYRSSKLVILLLTTMPPACSSGNTGWEQSAIENPESGIVEPDEMSLERDTAGCHTLSRRSEQKRIFVRATDTIYRQIHPANIQAITFCPDVLPSLESNEAKHDIDQQTDDFEAASQFRRAGLWVKNRQHNSA